MGELPEEADAGAEQYGCQLDGDFVHQVEVECLLDDAGTGESNRLGADENVCLTGRFFRRSCSLIGTVTSKCLPHALHSNS